MTTSWIRPSGHTSQRLTPRRTFAPAQAVRGKPTLEDKNGVAHNWAEELAGKLVSLQNDDGSWLNTSDRWQENSKTLCTAYAVGALAKAMAALPESPRPTRLGGG